MKSKKTIIDKTVYGGTLTDKYFFIFDDGTDMQVPLKVWDEYEIGTIFYVEDIPDEFENAMNDIKEGRTVPLDKALDEEPAIDWKEMHDMQQKLVTHYALENEKLKEEIKLLKNSINSVKKSFEYFQERFYKQRDLTEKFKKRAMEAEKKLKPSEKVDKICNQLEKDYKGLDYYRMHSHILETANDELAEVNKIMKEALINIWECFEIRSEIYHNDWVGLQALANKARICLESVGYEWRKDK
jgi:uncharacterized protein with HEPN domain